MEDALLNTKTQHTLVLNDETAKVTALDAKSDQLLFTVAELQGRLSEARKLSSLRSSLFSTSERAIIERTFESTKTAIDHIAALCQLVPDAVRVLYQPRAFTLQHSSEFQVYLARLHILSQHLSSIFVLLCSRQQTRTYSTPQAAAELPASPFSERFMRRSRRNMSRRPGGTSILSAVELPGPEPVELAGDMPSLPYLHSRPSSVPDIQELEADYTFHSLGMASNNITETILPKLETVELGVEVTDRELTKLTRDLDQLLLEAFAPHTIAQSHKADAPGKRLVGKARSRRWLETQASKPTG